MKVGKEAGGRRRRRRRRRRSYLAELVDVPLVVLHALLGEVQVGGELGQLLRVGVKHNT